MSLIVGSAVWCTWEAEHAIQRMAAGKKGMLIYTHQSFRSLCQRGVSA